MADSIPSFKRVDFEPDSLPATGPSARDEAAPAVSSSSALARFEFESGRGNDGTKILMVEWSDDDDTENTGDWEVSWEGKSTVLSAKDGAEGKLHRLYFLLPPRSPVPPIVKLEQRGGKTMQTNPLPAIFPPALGVSATTAGKKGVLHTVWAKKRLSVLQREIEQERENGEGVGLEMAVQEKAWIEHNFGVGAKGLSDVSSASPKSPSGSGRLSEKLRGLKLGTSVSELSSTTGHDPAGNNPLSPDHGDVAVSSFSLFHGHTARPPRAVAQQPPQHLLAMQNDSNRVSSLDAIATGFIPSRNETETEDDLFAVKLSPRSPEMKKSPFSFSTSDTARWIKTDE
ncbi:uncharacterized protein L3040_002964 [Drepanopeziza brunnea f. sp. 'multigermtubi']|uniref:Uncharacterized protein n=1 Tax=Marssonina brunnea f. sp. multigermtubi (strain MB_m1) TaxID=1072389 RepID=K1WWW8_MARBU|nr:uncharacterized protein MBM_08606 [Drepanopeziza brunnea f. sp. 'multigermtubi' MB_m1]EKD13163.1 hypothetical protein MBM_08606 [Drepanopeziza brunnea f. sp. 'multigermtubi' MB_m1]KAJ5047121.1 hypothetical protein L3040_002964 [Drepanopeziza brunnea f. sp. 'multigermtubi']